MPPIALNPISANVNLSDEVAARLREAIKSGDLLPGTRLIEQEIAEKLAVSRMPVREAIQKLVGDGLVIKEPRRGARVHPYTSKELEEVYSLRVLLECFVVERVMKDWSPKSYQVLRSIVDAMAQAAETDNKHRVYELDAEFHEGLWKLANHNVLLEVVSGLRTRISRFLLEAANSLTLEALDQHVTMHYDLLDLLNSGDIDAAQAEMSNHILRAKDRIKTYYSYLGK